MFIVNTDDEIYTGFAFTKDITGYDPELEAELTEGRDYTVTYSDNTDAGMATITIEGTGNYIGTLTYEFTIDPKEVTEDMFTVNTDNETYTGSKITKSITGYDDGTGADLAVDKDYMVLYENNVNAGTATIMIEGIGNYSGTLTYTFEIEKAKQDAHFAEPDLTKTTDDGSFENPLAGIEGDVTYSISGDEGVAEIDPVTGEVTLLGGTGTVIITATIAGDENHDDATISYTLTVTEPIPDHTHKYEFVDWIIDPATGGVYAEFKCECGDIIFKKADVTSEITKEPTATEDGVRTYTATVEYDGETYTTSWTEAIPALDTDTEPGPVVENPNGGTKTGDTNNILLWLVLLVAAAAIVLVCMRRRNARK